MGSGKYALMIALYSAVASFFSMPVWAQVDFGLRGGLNYSNIHFADHSGFTRFGLFFTPGYGFHAGADIRYGAWERVSLRSGLIVNQKGASEIPGYPFDNESLRRSLYYLSLPLLVNTEVWKGFAIEGGVETALLLNAGDERYKNKSAEIGWCLGLGKTFAMQYEIAVRYVQGLSPAGTETFPGQDTNGDDNSFTVKAFNRNLQISFAYFFIRSKQKGQKTVP